MAAYTFTHTDTTITFTVTGLTAGNVVRFFVRLDPNPGSNLVDEKYTATVSTMSKSFSVLQANNSYAVNVYVDDAVIGTQYFDTISGRPENWAWTSTVAAGAPIKITAQEWNSFCARINAFRTYKGLPEYSAFPAVSSGTPISASIMYHAIWAISAMSGHGTLPSDPVAGQTKITASFFNRLRDALNDIS